MNLKDKCSVGTGFDQWLKKGFGLPILALLHNFFAAKERLVTASWRTPTLQILGEIDWRNY